MFSFNSQGKRLKNGNVDILIAIAIASITCEKAKNNDRRAELRTGQFRTPHLTNGSAQHIVAEIRFLHLPFSFVLTARPAFKSCENCRR